MTKVNKVRSENDNRMLWIRNIESIKESDRLCFPMLVGICNADLCLLKLQKLKNLDKEGLGEVNKTTSALFMQSLPITKNLPLTNIFSNFQNLHHTIR
jgi:hypothetical protein